CKPDCKGLCPQCGLDLNESPEHVHEVTDLRFADLEALKEQLEREQGE
ncbi:YceD family protein, partial [Bifidobacterium animalis]